MEIYGNGSLLEKKMYKEFINVFPVKHVIVVQKNNLFHCL